jgi:hypothetical protein
VNYNLNFGVNPSGTFTRWINQKMLNPNGMVMHQGRLIFGNKAGYIYTTDESEKTDIIYDTVTSSYRRDAIPYNYLSCAIDMGTAFKRKWLTRAHFVGDNHGNVSAQPYVVRDMNFDYSGIKNMAPINYADNITWGNPTIVWGDETVVWNNLGKMDLWRRFPQTTLRADMVQIGLRPSDGVVYSSSVGFPEYGSCDVDSVAKTAVISTPSGYTAIIWPLDVVGMYISFSSDDYAERFLIIAVSGDTITYSDSTDLSITNTEALWQISGEKKEQRVHLSSLVIHYSYLGDENQSYPGAKSNSGSGNGGENP